MRRKGYSGAWRHGAVWCALLGGFIAPASALAQNPDGAHAALLPPVASDSDAQLGEAWNRLLRARLEQADAVVITEAPVLSLRDLQLSVGCLADTPACMASVARLLEVDALIVSTITTTDDTTVVTLTFHDAAPPTRRSVTRQGSGAGRERALLGEVDSAIEELFDIELPRRAGAGVVDVDVEADPARPRLRLEDDDGISPWAYVLVGTGVAAAGTGVAFALLANHTEDEYATAPTATSAQVDRAIEIRERGETQALLANILIASGAALAAAGLTVLLLTLPNGEEAEVHAWGTHDGGGITLAGRFGGDL